MELERQTNSLKEVTTLLQEWEVEQNLPNYNAIPTLNKLADNFEKEQENYITVNPDPLDARQPLYTNPKSKYQQILNLLHQKNFIVKLLNYYLCDGSKYKIAGCRLMLALMPGLDTSKLFQPGQDGLLQRLIKWAGNDIEPLQSYATAIIAALMEVPEVAIAHKDQNGRLVPLMLHRLSALQTSMRLLLNDATNEGESMPKRIKLHRDTADSGVEIKLATKQVCILRYLTSMGKYQEFMSHVFKHNALQLILWYVNVEETNEARLGLEALKYMSVLLGHTKFSLDFIKETGLERLLDVPRSSIAFLGVSLCLFSLAHCEKAMERLCLLPMHILNNLVKYELWLLESSHESVRCHVTIFFGITFQFRVILEEFDNEYGLEKLQNFISNPANLNEDIIGYVCIAYKRYLQTHLNIKVENLMEMYLQRTDFIVPRQQNHKAYNPSTEHIQEHIESLIQSKKFTHHWKPVDQLVQFGAISWLLEVIACSSTRVETVRNALDVLAIACVNLTVVLAFSNKEAMGMNIILQAADGKIGADPDVQKSALRVITNCVFTPADCIVEKGLEVILWQVWESVRVSNGIMVLLQLLNVETPVSEADCIRAFACRALAELARSETIREIISNHPIFTSGRIQNFLEEPISQEKRHEHVEFQNYAFELLKRLGINKETIHKRNIIAQTQIQFKEQPLLQLVQQYLSKKGLRETAATLLREAKQIRFQQRGVVASEEADHSTQNLEAYITENLANQHALCKYPMSKCPELFVPHKCRKAVKLQSNYAVRSTQNQMGYETYTLNCNLIHSQFCPVQKITLRDDFSMYRSHVRFLPGNQDILVGCREKIRIVNTRNTTEQSFHIEHGDCDVEYMEPNRDGTLLLTSAFNQDGQTDSALWSLNGFAMELALDSEEHVEFSKTTQDRIIGTRKQFATIFDINTGTPITRLLSNFNRRRSKNKATFSFNDHLILSYGVLFDVRTGHKIHKLDKINTAKNGVFHPNGLEIVSDTYVWDMRTYRLLKIVPVLHDCRCLFAPLNSVIYALPFDDALLKPPFDFGFITIDSSHYSTIANICVQWSVGDLDVNEFDTQLAIVEHVKFDTSVVKLYDVGRKIDEEVRQGDEEEEEYPSDSYSITSSTDDL